MLPRFWRKQVISKGTSCRVVKRGFDSRKRGNRRWPSLEPNGYASNAFRCKAIIAEFNAIDELKLDNLQDKAPLIYEQLASDAKSDEEAIEEYLAETSLHDYLGELMVWCHRELRTLETHAERYPAIVAMMDIAKDKLSMPWGRIDLFAKYQTTLDNQLYKAMQALRDAQESRNKFIEADVVTVADSPAEAA